MTISTAVAKAAPVRTIAVHEADGKEEGQDVEKKPQCDLQEPTTVLQVLIPLVTLVLDTHHCQ